MAGLAAAGCAGRGSGSATGDEALHLIPTDPTISLAPNQQKTVSFRLDNGGVPAAGRTVSFALGSNDPAGAPQGATLASATAVTDGSGIATASVRAGLPADFHVLAQIGAVTAQVMVIVQIGGSGTVVVSPFFTSSSSAAQRTSDIRVLFYDNSSCAALDVDAPPAPARDPATLAIGDSSVSFPFVSVELASAVFVQAVGPGPTILAIGCVDVPGSTLLTDGTVEVPVPLVDAVPDPVGTFAVTSTLTFAPPLAAAAGLAAPWADLADCPLDPAQLWLDCTMDALSPATAGDPLDCVPAGAPGAEGALGDAIAARRGAWLTDGTGATLTCRGARDGGNRESLDAVIQGLFGSPTPALIVALPAIAADAASMLASVRLVSTLGVAAGSSPGTYVVTHTLQTALFGPGWTVPVALAPLGLPVLQAVASASTSGGTLRVGRHGFTLRLGSVARAAFGPLALAPRGFPADVSGTVSSLFAQARGPGGASGCAALDAVLCPAVGQAAGCATAACEAGLTALAARLDGAFSSADGTGLDLTLTGTAPLVPVPGELRAQRLGVGETQSSVGAVWAATIDTSVDSAALIVPFDGIRD